MKAIDKVMELKSYDRKAEERNGTESFKVGDTGNGSLDGNSQKPLYLQGAPAWPLGDDLNIHWGNIGIGLDRKLPEGMDPPGEENEGQGNYDGTAR
ncbi:hypothetical protein MPNT_640002 [Candidatus Methylacidithermus pantelleriae]|uniref:Uncharacterized protein n=1 Tax=Candidatus Methylacidithermus pantelleriae TaxID=2744239 RepID=A0A8J2BQN5_9BACT|nr:hypothetical protein MPNT_640002 [Candidatus Methylacidithermus pantelleriae]